MRNVPELPDQPRHTDQDFYFSETPLEHFPDLFYQRMPYGHYLLYENWWDNEVYCWVQSGHNKPIEIVEHDLTGDFSVAIVGTRVEIRRAKRHHLEEFPIEEVRYSLEHEE